MCRDVICKSRIFLTAMFSVEKAGLNVKCRFSPNYKKIKQGQHTPYLCSLFLAGFWTFLYFVSFCFLANQWSRTTPDELPLNQGADAARAAIAFSFFSIITWVRADAGMFWTVVVLSLVWLSGHVGLLSVAEESQCSGSRGYLKV